MDHVPCYRRLANADGAVVPLQLLAYYVARELGRSTSLGSGRVSPWSSAKAPGKRLKRTASPVNPVGEVGLCFRFLVCLVVAWMASAPACRRAIAIREENVFSGMGWPNASFAGPGLRSGGSPPGKGGSLLLTSAHLVYCEGGVWKKRCGADPGADMAPASPASGGARL